MVSNSAPEPTVANDAQLIQEVRSALGRNPLFRGSGRINVSSCESIITLHGAVGREEDRGVIEALVRDVSGVRGIENKLRVQP